MRDSEHRYGPTFDRSLVDQAPWVPTHTSKGLSFVSKRIGNYQYNPEWGVLLDQFWVR